MESQGPRSHHGRPPPGVAGRRAPLGVRGPATGPRADLSQADTSHLIHQLYVKVVTGGDPDQKSREITLQILRYIHERLPLFVQMGVEIKVNKIRSQDLQSPQLREAMARRGVTRLPALTSPNNIYLGAKEIIDLYERNVKEFTAVGRREERPVEGEAQEDDLTRFYDDEMTFERAEEDAQETGIGEGEDMMDSYRRMMERREASESGRRRPGTGARVPAVARPAAAQRTGRPAPRPAPRPQSRPDNIAPPRGAPRAAEPVDPEDAEFQSLIDHLSQDIDGATRKKAFEAGGGDSLDDDGAADIQDDLMERAYYARISTSDE